MNLHILDEVRRDKGFTIKDIADGVKIAEGTVKNILTEKVKDPRLESLYPIAKFLGVTIDQLFSSEEKIIKEEKIIEEEAIKSGDISVLAQKDIYEYQMSKMEESHQKQLEDKEAQCYQRISELKEYYERIIAKDEQHINTIMLDKKWFRLAAVVGIVSLLALFFFIEFMTPGHGWFEWDIFKS
jgi:transcriptional regulator with XRE-family HTH domain